MSDSTIQTTPPAELDTTDAADASPWGVGIHPFARASLVLALVSLVLAIVIRVSDVEPGGFWPSFLVNVEGTIRDVVWQLAIIVLLVLGFAFVRRPDPAVDRFRGITGRGLWWVVAALVAISLSGPINHRDEGIGSIFSDAFAEALAGDTALDDDLAADEFEDEDYDLDDDLDY